MGPGLAAGSGSDRNFSINESAIKLARKER